jgi:hypothetical protein
VDIYGFAAIAVGVVGYFVLRNRSDGWAKFFLVVFGTGLGIVIGAVYAMVVIGRVFSGL